MMLCMGLHAQDFRINPSGYFENGGANVMVFSDVYPEGHQGGLTLVLNGDRRAANMCIRDRKVDDEYLFGSQILVAPLLESGMTGRTVYLPEGKWIDYQTCLLYTS